MGIVLSVGIITYNQAGFLRQCLDSVLAQEVDFPYEIVIGDDGSTDSTSEILAEYQSLHPGLITVLRGENAGISENYKKVLGQCKGAFVALLEGDDFWSDPAKLQTQVDFLQGHDEFGFVGCYDRLLFPDGHMEDDPYDYMRPVRVEGEWELYGDVLEFAKFGPVTRTVTICFRKSVLDPFISYVGAGNDLVLQTILAKYSKFAKSTRTMAVYRQGGVSTDAYNLKKQLYYNDWYVGGRLLQKRLFPEDCDWDEDELADRGRYILLRDDILKGRCRHALQIKKELKSKKYREKTLSRWLHGPVSCLGLSLLMRLKGTL